MAKKFTNITQLAKVSLKAQTAPIVQYPMDYTKGYVKWGKNNKRPSELIDLFNNHAEHGAIVKGKARYLSGLGIDSENEQAKIWLKKANPKESWFDLSIKIDKSKAIYGGFAVKVIPNLVGTPLEFYFMELGKLRFSPDGKCIYYTEKANKYSEKTIKYPAWYQDCRQVSIYVYKDSNPNVNEFGWVYPEPEYNSCTQDIDTDIRITTFFNNYVKNNWSSGQIINIIGAEGTKEEKDSIAETLLEDQTGEENGGKPTIIFSEKDSKGAEVLSLNASDLDKQYQELSKRNQQKILTGHNVNGALFKILVEGKLGDRNELDLAHELFINEYVKLEQEPKLKMLQKFFYSRTMQLTEFKIEQVKGVNRPLPLENQTVVTALNSKSPEIIFNYIKDYYGIEIPDTVVLEPNDVSVQQAGKINDNLKGLSAAENADVIRIVRDFQKGRNGMNEAMAVHRITSYGITESEAKKWLGISDTKLSAQKDFFTWFEENSHDINKNDEVLSVSPVYSIEEALKFELKNQKIYFATPLKVSVEDLRTAILEQLNANPALTVDELSIIFEVEPSVVQTEMEFLIEKKLLASTTKGGFFPTEKGAKKVSQQYKTEIYTEYTYELSPEHKGAKLLLETSHPFCKKMVSKYHDKAISLDKIEGLTNDFGMNAFDFRGGFTMTKEGIVEAVCRHIWYGTTKMRKVKI